MRSRCERASARISDMPFEPGGGVDGLIARMSEVS